MDDDASAFNGLRPRLQKIAYRMLGSVAEAEDIVQDVWLRWHAAAREKSTTRKRGSLRSRPACPSTVCALPKRSASTIRASGCPNRK